MRGIYRKYPQGSLGVNDESMCYFIRIAVLNVVFFKKIENKHQYDYEMKANLYLFPAPNIYETCLYTLAQP